MEVDDYAFYETMVDYHYIQWLYYHFLFLKTGYSSEEGEYHFAKIDEYDNLMDAIKEQRKETD